MLWCHSDPSNQLSQCYQESKIKSLLAVPRNLGLEIASRKFPCVQWVNHGWKFSVTWLNSVTAGQSFFIISIIEIHFQSQFSHSPSLSLSPLVNELLDATSMNKFDFNPLCADYHRGIMNRHLYVITTCQRWSGAKMWIKLNCEIKIEHPLLENGGFHFGTVSFTCLFGWVCEKEM